MWGAVSLNWGCVLGGGVGVGEVGVGKAICREFENRNFILLLVQQTLVRHIFVSLEILDNTYSRLTVEFHIF